LIFVPNILVKSLKNRIFSKQPNMDKKLISSGSIFEDEVGYSRAVVVGEFIFLSGCTGFNYETGTISENVQEQCEQTILNIKNALEQANSNLADVVKTSFYFADPSVFTDCKPIFKKHFGSIRLTLTAIGAQFHDERIKLEIEATAVKS
jgi:enamine deaminase RidA (YjgF/YER057c/UK114 family)